jgi:predicted peptidase
MTRMLATLMALTLVCLSLHHAVVAADTKPIDATLLQKFEARVFKDTSGSQLNYRWFKPGKDAMKTNLPLVLFLHGATISDSSMAAMRYPLWP